MVYLVFRDADYLCTGLGSLQRKLLQRVHANYLRKEVLITKTVPYQYKSRWLIYLYGSKELFLTDEENEPQRGEVIPSGSQSLLMADGTGQDLLTPNQWGF